MDFKRHIAQGISFDRAQSIGGVITPKIVVLHDTAGRLEKGNSANYLQSAPRGVSVHFIVERDGSVSQQVPVNRRAGHAGKSHYHGRDDVNNFSIGIEIVNPGRMVRVAGGKARAWFKQDFDIAEYGIQERTTPEHGHGLWMDYTDEQILAVEALLHGLIAYIPTLTDIAGHWYVSPGRKVDTNPLFPMDWMRARVLGREDIPDALADDASDPAHGEDAFVVINVPHAKLNMRRWPSFNPNVMASIPDGVIVPVIRAGVFDGRGWLKVRFDGLEGWIVKSHADPITSQPT